MKKFIPVLLLITLFISCSKHPVADQVVFGKTWTGDDSKPWTDGFAVVADSIVAVGSKEEIEQWIGPNTSKIETGDGNLIVPGFIDCHTHFMEGGFALSSVQLRDAKTPQDFINRIKVFAHTQPKGQWITSGDWDHENWGGELPTKEWIDSVTIDNPVWINRLDGHMCLANSAALNAASINDKVKSITGGTIVRNKTGQVTGIFKDNAMSLIDRVVPGFSDDQKDKALVNAMTFVAARGVTSVHNMSGYMDVFERARDQGTLKTRIYAGMMLSDWRTLNDKVSQEGRGNKWLRIGGLKEFVDGSLGSHTASFFKPFTDAPTDSGFFINTKEDLYLRIKSADSAGLQVM